MRTRKPLENDKTSQESDKMEVQLTPKEREALELTMRSAPPNLNQQLIN